MFLLSSTIQQAASCGASTSTFKKEKVSLNVLSNIFLCFRSSGGRQKSIEHLNDLTVTIPPVMVTSTQEDAHPIPRLSIDRPDVFARRQSAQRSDYDHMDEPIRESTNTDADLLLRGKPASQI
jgi:hypothetical protein